MPADLAPTCGHYASHPYDADIATIVCGDADGVSIFYTLFSRRADMDGDSTPTRDCSRIATGQACTTGRFLGSYTSASGIEGRLMCRLATGSASDARIEWTQPNLRILGYAVTTALSWDDVYAAWQGAGPVDEAEPAASRVPSRRPPSRRRREPTPEVEPSPSSTFPNALEAKILQHVPEEVRSTCTAIGPFFHEVPIEGVGCKVREIFVNYFLFASRSAMDKEFDLYGNEGRRESASDG